MDSIEHETAPQPTASIIWLHGLGADGHDFAPIVPQLGWPGQPALRYVFPHAPMRSVTVNAGMRMRAWYDIVGTSLAARQDAVGIRESASAVTALIAREVARGVRSTRIVLAGFSQGGAIALHTGLRHHDSLAGMLALSCYLPLQETLLEERSAANQSTPIWMAHGNQDGVVPLSLGQMSADRLRGLGYAVDWHTYAMAHAVCPMEIVDIRTWLQARLA